MGSQPDLPKMWQSGLFSKGETGSILNIYACLPVPDHSNIITDLIYFVKGLINL